MNISMRWLSEYVELSGVSATEVARILTDRGLEIESTRSLSKGFEKVITVKILERNKHPGADKLSLCKVSTGSGEPLQIVCGAQNMKAGDIVALAQIGAVIPNGLKIQESKIRGEVSFGMLCSEEELMMADEAEGILILPPDTKLGQPLADVLGRNDTILELKITPNRGDCLSMIGVAREVASALGKKVLKPQVTELDFKGAKISTKLDAGDQSLQFFGCEIEGVKVGPSPDWLKQKLESMGSRSINNVVDCTNYLMFETGQPVHAYDASKLKGTELSIRLGRSGEKLPLLDNTEVVLRDSDLVIADAERSVALAGAMGGGNSEVTDSTTKLYLECAEFHAVTVRKSAHGHDKKTDAATRFEKGIDSANLGYAISRLKDLIIKAAGGKVTGSTKTIHPRHPRLTSKKQIVFSPEYIREFLGVTTSDAEIRKTLTSLEIEVDTNKPLWVAVPPSYRNDLSIKEDLAEEIARTIGFDQIPATIPPLSSVPSGVEPKLIERAKDILVNQGLNETLTYAFNSRSWLTQFGLDSGIKIQNPLSEEQEVMVPSLIPGLMKHHIENENKTFGSDPLAVRLFEIRPVFTQKPGAEIRAVGETDTGTTETWKMAAVISGPRFASSMKVHQERVDFSDLKSVVESWFTALGTKGIRLRSWDSGRNLTHYSKIFHPGQTAEVWAGKDCVGLFGRIHPALAVKLKLAKDDVWLTEIDWNAVEKLSRSTLSGATFAPWAEFPTMERDFALVVNADLESDRLTGIALKAGKPLAKVAKIFDVYKGKPIAEGKMSIAVRVIFADPTRSLAEAEVEKASQMIRDGWKKELGIELRS
ncbi:MAG: phenylalanine--tRNA ligase subunit beta [Xanthomonadaceae bacterium]|nr:phenylalanine--tRNA ligase subunit beta [Xanthomonadaceae bacterium]